MQDQPFDQVARALVPVWVGLRTADDERIGDQPGIDNQARTVGPEQSHRIEPDLVRRKAVGGDAERIDDHNATRCPSAARRGAVTLASSSFGSSASTEPW